MNIDLAALPDDVDTLRQMVRTLAAERVNLTAAQAEIERLRLIVQKLQRRHRAGRSHPSTNEGQNAAIAARSTKPAGASVPRV